MADSPATTSIDDKPSLNHVERSSPSPDKDLEGSHEVDNANEARIM